MNIHTLPSPDGRLHYGAIDGTVVTLPLHNRHIAMEAAETALSTGQYVGLLRRQRIALRRRLSAPNLSEFQAQEIQTCLDDIEVKLSRFNPN